MIGRWWRGRFGRARAQRSVDAIVRWHRAKLADARAQRDQIKAQRDRAREAHAELRSNLTSMATELADVGGRFTALDFHASEADRAALAPGIAARAATGEPVTVRENEMLLERVAPVFHQNMPERRRPPVDLAFAVVASDLYLPGLEALLRSLHAIYPRLPNDVHVFHDGSLGDFAMRRLRRIHPAIVLHEPDMSWLSALPDASPNHRRVGRLGYMGIHALALTGYSRVLLLDADLLVLGDISRLWAGDAIIVCPDCGERDYAVRSPFTGEVVINSGVVSLPASALGPERLVVMQALARDYAARPVCSTLDRFADQKVWNIALKGQPRDLAPLNYNCNVKFLARSLEGHPEAVSILHFAGAKPWIDARFLPSDLVAAAGTQSFNHPRFWLDPARQLLLADRTAQFRDTLPARRSMPRRAAPTRCRIVDANPARLPPADEVEERIAPAAFVLAGGDPAAVEHLVLPPAVFGGLNRQHPAWPGELLLRLAGSARPPALWVPFYFREFIEGEALGAVEVNYLLFEEPFRRFADQAGRTDLDPDTMLDDLRDPVLTLALPAAIAMGFRTILAPPPRPGADDRILAARAHAAAGVARVGGMLVTEDAPQYAL